MEKLTVAKRLSVVKLFLSGFSHQQIAAKTDVAVGSVSTIITELKQGAFFEAGDMGDQVDLLREVALGLKHAGVSPGQSAVGLAVLNRITECGLDVTGIERLHEILKLAGGPDKAKEFVAAVYRIRDFQEKIHMTLDEIDAKVLKMEEKAAELQPAINKVNEMKQEIADLEKMRDGLIPVVDNLEYKHNTLNSVVKDLQLRQSGLIKQIKEEEAITASTQAGLAKCNSEIQKLAKAGFTIDELTEFNEKVRVVAAHHKVPMSTIRNRLLQELKIIGKGLTLETFIKGIRAELQKEQKAITLAKEEFKKLGVTNGTLSGQNATLEAEIRAKQETVTLELGAIVSAAKEALGKFNSELKQSNDAVIGVVNHLKDQALEVGFATGKYEGIVQGNEWLIALRSLAEGQETLDAAKVRGLLSRVLHGAQLWIKLNAKKPGLPPDLSKVVEMLVIQLQGWSI